MASKENVGSAPGEQRRPTGRIHHAKLDTLVLRDDFDSSVNFAISFSQKSTSILCVDAADRAENVSAVRARGGARNDVAKTDAGAFNAASPLFPASVVAGGACFASDAAENRADKARASPHRNNRAFQHRVTDQPSCRGVRAGSPMVLTALDGEGIAVSRLTRRSLAMTSW
jgi:hypothetical protein